MFGKGTNAEMKDHWRKTKSNQNLKLFKIYEYEPKKTFKCEKCNMNYKHSFMVELHNRVALANKEDEEISFPPKPDSDLWQKEKRNCYFENFAKELRRGKLDQRMTGLTKKLS